MRYTVVIWARENPRNGCTTRGQTSRLSRAASIPSESSSSGNILTKLSGVLRSFYSVLLGQREARYKFKFSQTPLWDYIYGISCLYRLEDDVINQSDRWTTR